MEEQSHCGGTFPSSTVLRTPSEERGNADVVQARGRHSDVPRSEEAGAGRKVKKGDQVGSSLTTERPRGPASRQRQQALEYKGMGERTETKRKKLHPGDGIWIIIPEK